MLHLTFYQLFKSRGERLQGLERNKAIFIVRLNNDVVKIQKNLEFLISIKLKIRVWPNELTRQTKTHSYRQQYSGYQRERGVGRKG